VTGTQFITHGRRRARRTLTHVVLAITLAGWAASLGSVAFAKPAADPVTFISRDYDVAIQANGDVRVVEHWNVAFSGGPFTSATLGVYTAHTSGIEFGHVVNATANSEHLIDVRDRNGSLVSQISWTFDTVTDATRKFDIPYTLHGAVAFNDQTAWFDWHFLDGPKRSAIPVNSVRITVSPPVSSAFTVQTHYPDNAALTSQTQANGATATVTGQSISSGQSLEMLVTFPRASLDGSAQKPRWQGAQPPTLPTALGDDTVPALPAKSDPLAGFLNIEWIVLGVGVLIVFILALVVWRQMRKLRRSSGAEHLEDEESADEPQISQEMPAINYDFKELKLPPRDVPPTVDGFDFSYLAKSRFSQMPSHSDSGDSGTSAVEDSHPN
jgi:hypothetical protein